MSAHGSRTAWAATLVSTTVGVALLTTGQATALAGPDAPAAGYGFAAKLTIGDKAACSGALVDAQWVITAASCFRDGASPLPAGKPALKTTVTVGRTDLTQSTGAVVDAVELVPHADRDLVMVKLAWRIVGVDPVKVATTAPVAGEQLTSLGFGRTKTEWVPDKAHTGGFTVASLNAGTVGLAASGDGAAVCKGDTGGPALRQKGGALELAAVNSLSWQAGCLGADAAETRTGAVDVRLDDVAGWIDQVRGTTPEVRLASLVPKVTGVLTTGDFNRDGRTDVAAVTDDGNLHTFAGRSDGTFEYGRSLWTSDGSWGGATKIIGGDFNGDGMTDIAAVWSGGGLRMYAGRPDGGLADGKVMWADASTNWNAMLQLDRYRQTGSDRDGILAVWGTGGGKGSLYAYSAGADGVLNGQSRKMWPDTTWTNIQKISSGDFNGDGRDDVVAIASDGALRRYSGNTAGGLDDAASMWPDTTWNNTPVLLAGDFNGDGKTDIGGLSNNQQRFSLYKGNGQGALAGGTNAWPSPVPVPAGGRIRNVNSGKCLEITNSSKDNGALAQQWTCGSQGGAQWEYRPTATAGVYQIVNVSSGKCLEITNSSKDNGARAQQYTCYDIPTMQWTITQAGSTVSLNISNVNSGKTLEIGNSSKDNGAPAQQWGHSTDPAYPSQSWYL
ncbi:RICIN domain-containing protein [Streptomyces sp. NPDC087917]|uniref:RICIN domain-containing protein n=1 Tax=Streptomyces sp. NPDC087917 TaxID=3155060 RepID=UPI0034264CD8